MNTVYQEITVDITDNTAYTQSIYVKQGDTARGVAISLTRDGAAYQIPTGSVCTCDIRKADKTVSYLMATNKENVLYVDFTDVTLATAGRAVACVTITGNDSKVLSSFCFFIRIIDTTVPTGEIKAQDEYKALADLLASIADAGASAEIAKAYLQTIITSFEIYAQDEAQRVTNENQRITSETERNAAEETRAQNEAGRTAAESERTTEEGKRATAETARATAEGQRAANETARDSAEQGRTTKESERQAAETARTGNETGRINAENSRVDAENNRNSAEAARVNAEKAREDYAASLKGLIDGKAPQSEVDRIFYIIKNFAPVHEVDSYAQFAEDIESGKSAEYVTAGDKTDINWVNTVTGVTTFDGSVACEDEQKFINAVGEAEAKNYNVLYYDGKWYYDGREISLQSFGLTITGTPKNGDVLKMTTTVTKVNFTFTSYDTAQVGDGVNAAHNWLVEETYCRLGTLNFDGAESAICITVGHTLHAGKYYIRNVSGATSDYWCNYKRLYYCFEIEHDITATEETGDIQLRRTSIGNRETTGDARGVYQIYCKPYSCNTNELIEDVTVEFVGQVVAPTEEYTDLRTIEYFNTDQSMESTGIIYNNLGHAVYGNNDFARSNMIQYLNSDEKSMNPVRLHKNDVLTSIKGKKGYLYGLDPRVKKIIAPVKVKLQHGLSDEFTTYQDFTFDTNVYLLTMKEMSFNVNTTEGKVTQLYNEYTGGVLTNNAIAGRAKYNKEGGSLVSYRCSSSAYAGSSIVSWLVSSTGANVNNFAHNGYYFAPAFIFAKGE